MLNPDNGFAVDAELSTQDLGAIVQLCVDHLMQRDIGVQLLQLQSHFNTAYRSKGKCFPPKALFPLCVRLCPVSGLPPPRTAPQRASEWPDRFCVRASAGRPPAGAARCAVGGRGGNPQRARLLPR